MPGHDIIVVGASAGGVEAVSKLVADLPSDLPAAIFVVIHVSPHSKSLLPAILSRRGRLKANHPTDGEAIVHGHIYIAPPDNHLLVKRGYIRLVQGPKENHCRPAVDPLFRTAAKAYGHRVVGVILSGTLDDGTAGLIDVKRSGGVTIVQNPDEALHSGMPSSAIEHAEVDRILPLSSIASVLADLAREPAIEEEGKTMPDESEMEMEPDVVELDGVALRERGHPGSPSGLICPDCGGSLYQLNERKLLRFRCRVGHAFSGNSLLAHQYEAQEEALWAAIRSLEERGELMQQMAANAREHNRRISAERFAVQAQDARQRADFIRETFFQGQLSATLNPDVMPEVSQESQKSFNVVVLAASIGGLNALRQILPALPQNFPAALIVMQHLDSQSDLNLITEAINRPTTLPLKQAQDGEQLQPGIVYIVPPQQHLLVNPDGTLSLYRAVFVNFIRPSTDLLFESVAGTFKERAIAVILSGEGSDGALGVQAIHQMGGKVIAQDESTCEFFEMPNAAIQTGKVDFVLPPNAIASTLVNLLLTDSAA